MKRSVFFSRRQLGISLIIVLAVYMGLWISVLTAEQIVKQKNKHAIAIQQAKFNSQKPEEQAIQKAEAYLKTSVSTIKPEQRLILDYLQRRFNLDQELSAIKSPIQISKNPATYPQEIHFLARIAYPNEVVNQAPRNIVDGPLLTNIYSANCDHMALPKNFWSTMDENYNAGGYSLTHNALALAFMKDNGCTIPTKENDLREKTVDSMVKIMDDPDVNDDLRYEAIAFLGLSGRSDLIEASWISKIVTAQSKEGNWTDATLPKDSDHTTVLALWALLEYTHPNSPYEPIIHRPIQQP